MNALLSAVVRSRPTATPPVRRGRLLPWAATAAAYLAVSLWLFRRVAVDLGRGTVGHTSADSHLFVWWLEWTPWALRNGENPLFTTFMHAPYGVNGMWNTSVIVLGVPLAPVTALAGPVVTYNLAMIAGPVVAGLLLVWALGRWTTHWWPRAVGGLLYAFSPFMVAHASAGHLNLMWNVLPPVLVWAVHALLVQPTRRPWLVGAALGLVFAAQTGLYTQTVALSTLALLLTAAVLAAWWPHLVASRVRVVGAAGTACVGVWLAVCAYPLWLLLAGDARPQGQIRDPAITGADAANLLVPTDLTWWAQGMGQWSDRLASHQAEQGGYLGVITLAVLALAVGTTRRPAVRVAAVVAAALWVLSLGAHLTVLGDDRGVALPWDVLHAVPLVGQAEAMRLQSFVVLAAVVAVTLWWDELAAHTRPWRWAAGATAVAVALTWTPAPDAIDSRPATVPAFFAHADQHLTRDDVVETVPRTSGVWDGGARPMLWQAATGMAYRTTGGYFIGSSPDQPLVFEAEGGAYQDGVDAAQLGDTARADQLVRPARADLDRLGVTVVLLVDDPAVDTPAVAAWTERVVGAPGERIADAWLYRLQG